MLPDAKSCGFDEAFLREFAEQQERLADELEHKADAARIAARSARAELARRTDQERATA